MKFKNNIFKAISIVKKVKIKIVYLINQNRYALLYRFIISQFKYARYSGLLKSSAKGRPYGPTGNPIPWITTPAFEFLERYDLKHLKLIELGSGNSTLYWQNRVDTVFSLEHDSKWLSELKEKVKSNVDIEYWEETKNFAEFDFLPYSFIVIDGLERASAIRRLEEQICEAGIANSPEIVLFDNSNWFPESNESFRNSTGYIAVDFVGFSPGINFQTITRIYLNPLKAYGNAGNIQKTINRDRKSQLIREFRHSMDTQE